MKKSTLVVAVTLMCVSSSAGAWFFFFFPIPTGGTSSGNICVAEGKKEGDTFRSANGNVATIKSVAGTSSACRNPALPIVAKVDFVMSSSFTPKAGMSLPDGFAPQGLTDLQRFNGMILFAKNNATDAGVFVSTTRREVISDMRTYAANLRANQLKSLDDAQQSEIEELTVNDMKAWRFETKGKVKNLFGTRYTYLMTVLEGDNEAVAINAWTTTGNYETQKADLQKLAFGLNGIKEKSSTRESSPAAVLAAAPSIDPSVAATPDIATLGATTAPPEIEGTNAPVSKQETAPTTITTAKASIVITSEPLRGHMADVEINGKHVAKVGPDQPYKGLHEPGKVVVTTQGGRVEIDAAPNKEYVFQIVLEGSTPGLLAFGLAGSGYTNKYPISLKTTRDLAPPPLLSNEGMNARPPSSEDGASGNAVIQVQPAVQTTEEKLKELKRLNDAGLISKEVYLEQQRAILSKP